MVRGIGKYGEIKEKSGQTDNPYLYCGEYYDENTSLYYLRARYMNPSTGTFISMDSYQGNKYDPASLHKYTYAQNNPMMYNDPSGHFVNMISYVASTVIQNTISNSHTIFVMGVLSGITNVIINEVLGTGRDIADAFTEGFINGVVGALVFSAIAAIAAFYEISIFVIMYFGAAFDFAKNLCFAIAAYSTNKTECIMYAVLAVLDIITMWTSVRQINIVGDKGTTEVHIKRNATMSTDGDVGVESGSKADVLAQNRANGRAFEQQEFAKFSSQNNNAVEQITVKTSSGVRTRVDAIGLDANGNVVINEYKSSINAPLTNNQTRAFPEIFESGGVVVGKGKGIFTGGYQIPAGTEVTIVRPN